MKYPFSLYVILWIFGFVVLLKFILIPDPYKLEVSIFHSQTLNQVNIQVESQVFSSKIRWGDLRVNTVGVCYDDVWMEKKSLGMFTANKIYHLSSGLIEEPSKDYNYCGGSYGVGKLTLLSGKQVEFHFESADEHGEELENILLQELNRHY